MMKIIVINRKRLGVTTIIVGLMVVLLGFETMFERRLQMAALVQNNVSSMKQYSALNNAFTFKLPSNWICEERSFGGNEILYHCDFVSNDSKVHGVVEVWNYKQDLKAFLDSSREISERQNIIRNYDINNIKINGKNGYIVTYDISSSNNVWHKAYEYFINENGKLIRFSFFVPLSNFNESMPNIFKIITETYQYKG